MATHPSFKLPKSFLSQLGEFTTGYVLITVNELGEFETFVAADTPAVRLGLGKFTEMVAGMLDAEVSNTMGLMGTQAEEQEEENEEGSEAGEGTAEV